MERTAKPSNLSPGPMLRRRGNDRGLAEIVGTLMLVLIVVAAATAFAFFISSEEQMNLAERTALEFKNLENVSVQSVINTPPSGNFNGTLVLVLTSTDIYNTSLTDIAVGGNPVTSFCIVPTACNLTDPADTANFERFAAAGGTGYLTLLPFSVTAVTLNYTAFYLQPFVFSNHSLQIQMGTTRGNEFVETLFPPIAEFGVDFVSGYPVLDGSQSYQPHTGSSPNATISQWVWTVVDTNSTHPTDPDDGSFYGQQAQLPAQFIPGSQYNITLTVTNTLGLTGTAAGSYEVP
jgi:flagellin-like protein